MKKNSIILFAIFIALIIITQPVKQTLGIVKEYKSPMDTILDISNGQLYEVRLLAWAKLNSKFMTVEEMKNTLVGITKSYYNTQSVPQFHIEENYKSCEIMDEIHAGKSLQIILQSYRPTAKAMDLSAESYLLTEIAQNNTSFTLEELKKEIYKIYDHYDIFPEITITYTARIEGRITNTQAQEIFNEVIAFLNLTYAEEITGNEYFALTGYSKAFPEGLIIGGKKRNFTLNIRYSYIDNTTYIVFGTPDIGGQG